jgi:hypothetical protein
MRFEPSRSKLAYVNGIALLILLACFIYLRRNYFRFSFKVRKEHDEIARAYNTNGEMRKLAG